MGRPAIASLFVVLASVLCLGASDDLVNDAGATATGVVVTFSAAVRVTAYDDAVFASVDPEGSSTRFTFSGGRLLRGRRFSVSWTPSWATVEATEWLTPVVQNSKPVWQTSILGDLEPAEMPVIQEWANLNRLFYGALILSTNAWNPMGTEYAGFESSDWQILRLRGALSGNGVVFRIEFAPTGHPSRDPAVEYEISLGSYGAVLVTCDETGASIWTSVYAPKVHLSYYTVQRDAITVALTLANLGSIGCEPQLLLGLYGHLGVKYRTEKVHYFIYYDGTTAALSRIDDGPSP